MLSENQKLLVAEAYRLTELRLDVQIQFAVASDQRSLVLAGVSVALAGLLAGVLSSTAEHFWSVGAVTFLSLSSVFAVAAAFPQKMIAAGSRFGRLRDLIEQDQDFDSVIAGLGEENDNAITVNEGKAAVRAHMYRIGLIMFAVGVCFALISTNSLFSATLASN